MNDPQTRCYSYQDDDDDATRCIRKRGHTDSHNTSRGQCWPNPANPKRRYTITKTANTIVRPRPAKSRWSR
jgi:hypothetical protein